jgi:enoyl-CoA hydratase
LEILQQTRALLPLLKAPEVRALVITGQGRFFSAGLDLFEVFAYPPEQAAAFPVVFDEVVTGLFALEIPVVAAVNGHAVAGGAVLAATADFRLLCEGESQLGLSEIRVGVPFPASALEVVRSAWSGPHLADLLYRGRNFRPAEALAAHLVDELVPADSLLERALALAEELGSRVPAAFAATKRALRQEALARIAAVGGPGQDPVWTQWRSPEILAAVESYRLSLAKKRS